MDQEQIRRDAEAAAQRIINAAGRDAEKLERTLTGVQDDLRKAKDSNRRLYYQTVHGLVRARLNQLQHPVVIEQRADDDRQDHSRSRTDHVYTRLRRTRGAFLLWQRSRQGSVDMVTPLVGMLVAGFVLTGVVHLPLWATLLGAGIVGRWLVNRQDPTSPAGYWLGIGPTILTLLGGMWWLPVAAIAIHVWLWPKTTTLPAGAPEDDEGGPPHSA